MSYEEVKDEVKRHLRRAIKILERVKHGGELVQLEYDAFTEALSESYDIVRARLENVEGESAKLKWAEFNHLHDYALELLNKSEVKADNFYEVEPDDSPWANVAIVPYSEPMAQSSAVQQVSGSTAPYEAGPQEPASRPDKKRSLPPISYTLPCSLSRGDPRLIGMTEVYVRPPADRQICPRCGERHKMYRCPVLLKEDLQGRWYIALRAGVCLNCMITGHSSISCDNVGACSRCNCRHNSVLCPQGPWRRH